MTLALADSLCTLCKANPWIGGLALGATVFTYKKLNARYGRSRPDELLLAGGEPSLSEIPGEKQRFLTTFTPARGIAKATIVLIHGFGCCSYEWHSIVEEMTEKGLNVFSYDRILFADVPSGAPRNSEALVAELHALLEVRAISGPVILLGHSYGALVAQCYAMTHPEQVSGLVLIDPAHEDQFRLLPADFTFFFKLSFGLFFLYSWLAPTGFLRVMDKFGLFNFPPLWFYERERRRAAARLYSHGPIWSLVSRELRGSMQTFAEMPAFRASHSLAAGLPMALVLAADRRYSPTLRPAKATEAFVTMHQHLVAQGASLRMATKSDHWVHLQQPDLILEAVEEVVNKVKGQ